MAIADKLAGAMVPTTDQSSVRRRWGIIKTINANQSVNVDVAGVVITNVKRLASYQPTVGERVQLDVVGTDMVVSGATAPSARAFRRPVGDIEMTFRKTPKPDTLFLDGATKNRSGVGGFPDLWNWAVAEGLHNGLLFGNGNGTTTFTLPDMRGRVPIGAGTQGADTYALGLISGASSKLLVTANMPAHTHSVAVANHTAHAHSVQVAAHATHTHTINSVGTHIHDTLNGRLDQSGNHGGHYGSQVLVAAGPDYGVATNVRTDGGQHGHYFELDIGGGGNHTHTEQPGGPTTHSVTETTGGPTTHTVTEASVGGTTPVDVRQPSIAVNWLIWC